MFKTGQTNMCDLLKIMIKIKRISSHLSIIFLDIMLELWS
jgi:hypothetical protein